MAAFDASAVRAAILGRAIGTHTNALGNNITVGSVLAVEAATHEDDERADLASVVPRLRVELLSMAPQPRVGGGLRAGARLSELAVRATLTHAVKGVDLDSETTRNALLDGAGTMAQAIARALETAGTTALVSAGIVGGLLRAQSWKRTRFDRELLEHVLEMVGVIQET